MADRYVDKQIKVLEFICKNNFREDAVTSSLLKITDDELEKILEELQWFNFLKIQQKDLLNINDEHRAYDDILIYYVVTSKDGLANLLAKLKKNYPRHSKPIIREKTLEKISKHFSDVASKEEIVELLIECGVPKSLIGHQPTKWKMVFSILNYYALSTKKDDYNIFAKIIEGIVHPLMSDGNKEEAQKVATRFNGLIEYDDFVIKDSHLRKIKHNDPERHSKLDKNTFSAKTNTLKTPIASHIKEYVISAKDREIRINDYLLSKPHAVGSNFEFFLFLLANPDKEIKKSELSSDLRSQIGKKSFSKILNALGFKGEILKTFFPKRGKSSLLFKQQVNYDYIVNSGIREGILLKELELAHIKNSSE